jgi:membrane protein required for colicin V production
VSRLDALFLVVLALFALRGFARGVFRESFGLAGAAAGLAAAAVLGPELARVFRPALPPEAALVAAWAACVLGALAIAAVAARLLESIARALLLRPLSRLAGAAVGSAKGAALLGVGLLATQRLAPSTAPAIARSRLAAPLTHFAHLVLDTGRDLAPAREAA